jgi:predicted protein tyrosine phosphatase
MAGKKILTVCSANVNRSVTAEWVLNLMDNSNEVWSRGSNKEACKIHGGIHCSETDTIEADVIICMEDRNRKELLKQYGDGFNEKIVMLNIPDKYKAFDSGLILEILMNLPENIA